MKEVKKKAQRKAGVLMPISALPSTQGIGTLGASAYRFVDWLHSAGMKIWQVLPLLPTGYGDSPDQSASSDALNPYFIDLDLLAEEGLLLTEEYADIEWSANVRRVDYSRQFIHKIAVLRKAFARFERWGKDWRAFLKKGKYADFALFMALKMKFNYAPWTEWPEPYKNCKGEGLDLTDLEEEILFWQFTQFIFLKQWNALHKYAKERGISIMGDMPIYVSQDSVEMWKYREKLFLLNGEGNSAFVAGVPPDAFSEDGQLWGNPVYNWAQMQADGYDWWKQRIAYAFELFDSLRIDHFRAFDKFFVIPSEAENAKEGEWRKGPGMDLFASLQEYEIIAEDLGIIDNGVRKLLRQTGYPGMKVLSFAFDGNPKNEYLPSNIKRKNCVAYTGTHDNQPLCAFLESLDKNARRALETTLEEECLSADVPYITETVEDECKTMIELLMWSKANTVIFPMNDVLCMGEESRFNAPSTVSDKNWTFRFIEKDFGFKRAAWLKGLTKVYKR